MIEHDQNHTLANRTRKAWWVILDHHVQKAVGYSCAPNNPDSWWFPQIGYTMQEGYHVFDNESDAISKAINEIDQSIASLNHRLECLITQSLK